MRDDWKAITVIKLEVMLNYHLRVRQWQYYNTIYKLCIDQYTTAYAENECCSASHSDNTSHGSAAPSEAGAKQLCCETVAEVVSRVFETTLFSHMSSIMTDMKRHSQVSQRTWIYIQDTWHWISEHNRVIKKVPTLYSWKVVLFAVDIHKLSLAYCFTSQFCEHFLLCW